MNSHDHLQMNENWQKSCKIYRFTEFTTFKLKSLALKVAKSLPVFYTLRAGPLSKGGCLRSSALWFNSYPLSRFHWFLEMLRVLHVLKFEIFKHLIYVTTFAGFELKNSFKVENKNSKLKKFDNIEFNFIEQYLSPIFLFVISPQKPTFRPTFHPLLCWTNRNHVKWI